MQRREFIKLIGGAATAWPLAARAQQSDRMGRIGVLMNLAADDSESPVRFAAFAQGLQELGWIVGGNVRIDIRWGASDPDRSRSYAAELVALAPDVILASGTNQVRAGHQPKDCQGARARRASYGARARRRRDRVTTVAGRARNVSNFDRAQTGHQNHCRGAQQMSLMGQKPALPHRNTDARFTSISRPQ
jgi:hypothetical protein